MFYITLIQLKESENKQDWKKLRLHRFRQNKELVLCAEVILNGWGVVVVMLIVGHILQWEYQRIHLLIQQKLVEVLELRLIVSKH